MKYWIFIFELFLFLSNCSVVSCDIHSYQTVDSFDSDFNPILSSSSLYLSESVSRLYALRWEFNPYRFSSFLSSSIHYCLYSSLSSFILLPILLPILRPILYPGYPPSNSFDFLSILFHLVKEGITNLLSNLIHSI